MNFALKRLIVLAGLAVFTASPVGCSSPAMTTAAGRHFDLTYISKIQQGKTTKAEVLQALGWPWLRRAGGLGEEIWMYYWIKDTFVAKTMYQLHVTFVNDIVSAYSYIGP